MKSDASTDRITVSGIREDILDRLDALADAQDTSRSALEAAPLGFSTQADDYIEDSFDAVGGVWEEFN